MCRGSEGLTFFWIVSTNEVVVRWKGPKQDRLTYGGFCCVPWLSEGHVKYPAFENCDSGPGGGVVRSSSQ